MKLPDKNEIAKATFEHILNGGINDYMHGMYAMKKMCKDLMKEHAIEFRKWCEVKEVEFDFMGEVNHTTEDLYEIFCSQTAAGCSAKDNVA